MKKLDEIVFYACCIVLLLMGFAGGVITAIEAHNYVIDHLN